MEEAAEKHVVCPICAEAIVDEGEGGCVQDAVFCEGDCQCWLHRWCAGVTRKRYLTLSSTEDPFLCPSCTVAGQQAAITAQQGDIAQLRECVNALTGELRALKATVAAMRNQPLPANSAVASPTGEDTSPWSVVVRKRNVEKGHGRGGKGCMQPLNASVQPTPVGANTSPSTTTLGASAQKATGSGEGRKQHHKRVAVTGARRVWGTVRATTSTAVKTTLQRLTTSSEDGMVVKRKYKTAKDNSKRVTRWWFVVRGTEEALKALEAEWPKVAAQTAWKLEPLYSYDAAGSASPPPADQSPRKGESCLAYPPTAERESTGDELPESYRPPSPTSTHVTQNSEGESSEQIVSSPSTTPSQPMRQGNMDPPLQSTLSQVMQKQGDKQQQRK